MKIIQSKVKENLKWEINTNKLSQDDITFIEQCGRWLENIIFNNELTKVKALIL